MFFEADTAVAKNPVIQERRLGKFFYTHEFLVTTPASALRNVFSKIIPISVSFDYAQQCFAITAFSEHFEPVDENCEIPQYQVTIHVMGKKKPAYHVKFAIVEPNPLSALLAQ